MGIHVSQFVMVSRAPVDANLLPMYETCRPAVCVVVYSRAVSQLVLYSSHILFYPVKLFNIIMLDMSSALVCFYYHYIHTVGSIHFATQVAHQKAIVPKQTEPLPGFEVKYRLSMDLLPHQSFKFQCCNVYWSVGLVTPYHCLGLLRLVSVKVLKLTIYFKFVTWRS